MTLLGCSAHLCCPLNLTALTHSLSQLTACLQGALFTEQLLNKIYELRRQPATIATLDKLSAHLDEAVELESGTDVQVCKQK